MNSVVQRRFSRMVRMNNGLKIPSIGLGVFGAKDHNLISDSIVKVGYRHIDAAQALGNEQLIGEGVNQAVEDGVKREDIHVSSKMYRAYYEDPVKACQKTLKALKLDYLDLFMVHWPMPDFEKDKKTFKRTPMYQVWQGMEECVRLGLTKSIGVSNFGVQMMIDMLTYADIPPACNQVEVHPYYQQQDLVKFCDKYDITVIAYSPLSCPARPVGGKCSNALKDPLLEEIAATHGKTVAQIALAWNLQLGNVVIPKTNNLNRAQENLEACSITLSAQEMRKISSISTNQKIFDPKNWPIYGKIPLFA
ncbi:unnamed protein product [Moneuplotes crassus]|uniref:NADP-dependent oxidoreductase domain-containing protein n=1 Tax=Euplotes crassus TaxID=5936 RepID=A0AAD1XPD5_EUPCR|nr:unnamed protein product [Moneuplotes crassus]